MRSPVLAAVLALAGAAAIGAQSHAPLKVVPTVDLDRYLGTWYEIARLPNRFQQKCTGDVTAIYSRRGDEQLTVTNRCRTADGVTDASGVAKRVSGQPASVLKVRFAPRILSFLPAVWGDYQIIELAADYSDVVVGTPDRKYLWILARKPGMDEARYAALVDRARAQGFDTSRLVRTPQSPANVR
jgi:apolipoprotein D and lipocalin family protein